MPACCSFLGKSSSERDQTLLWDPPDLSGWLDKEGGRNTAWKRRYFILKGSNLFWFDGQGAIKPRGLVPLEGATVACRTVVNRTGEQPHALHIQLAPEAYDTASRQHLTLAAVSEELQDLWYRALSQAAIPRPELLARLHEQGRLEEVTGGRLTVTAPTGADLAWTGPPSAAASPWGSRYAPTAAAGAADAGAGPGAGYHASMSFRAATVPSAAATVGASSLDRWSRAPLLDNQYETASTASYGSEPVVHTRRMTTSVGASRHAPSRSDFVQPTPAAAGAAGGRGPSRGRHHPHHHAGGRSPPRDGSRGLSTAGGGRDERERKPLLAYDGSTVCSNSAGSRSDDLMAHHNDWDRSHHRRGAAASYAGDEAGRQQRLRASTHGEGAGRTRQASAWSEQSAGAARGRSRSRDHVYNGDDPDQDHDWAGVVRAPSASAVRPTHRSSVSPPNGRAESRSYAAAERTKGAPPAANDFKDDDSYTGGGGEGGGGNRRQHRGQRHPSHAVHRGDDGASVSTSVASSLLDTYLEHQAPLAAPSPPAHRRTSGGDGRPSSIRPGTAAAANAVGKRQSVSPNARGSVSWAPSPAYPGQHSAASRSRDDPRVSHGARGGSVAAAAAAAPAGSSTGSAGTSVASAGGGKATASAGVQRSGLSIRPSRIPAIGAGELIHLDEVSEQLRRDYIASLETQLSGLQESVEKVQAVLQDMQHQQQAQAVQLQQAQAQAQLAQLQQAKEAAQAQLAQLQLQQAQAQARLSHQMQVAAAEARTTAMLQQSQSIAAVAAAAAAAAATAAPPAPTSPWGNPGAVRMYDMRHGSVGGAPEDPSRPVAAVAAAREQERSVLVQMQHTLVRMLNDIQPDPDAAPSDVAMRQPSLHAHHSPSQLQQHNQRPQHGASHLPPEQGIWQNAALQAAGSSVGDSSWGTPLAGAVANVYMPPSPAPPPGLSHKHQAGSETGLSSHPLKGPGSGMAAAGAAAWSHHMAPPTPPMPAPFAASAAPSPVAPLPLPPPAQQAQQATAGRGGGGPSRAEMLDQIRSRADFKFKKHVPRESIAPVMAAAEEFRGGYSPTPSYYAVGAVQA